MIVDEDRIPVEFWFLPGKKHKDGGRIGFLVQVWRYKDIHGKFYTWGLFEKTHEIERKGEKIHHRPMDWSIGYVNYRNQSVEAARSWAEKFARKRISKWKDAEDSPMERTLIHCGGTWIPEH